jgi:N-acyl-D-aspartate/D-glutamate deacylase
MSADLVIRGGTVVDGTGEPAYRADVAVTDGRIVGIGQSLEGERVLDAEGHVVAPGFIDIHTHFDAQVFWDAALTPSCLHGVTTVVAGNCGFSIAPTRPEHRTLIARTLENVEDMNVATLAAGIPWDFESFPEYLASVERHGTALNFTAYVGHTALRLFVMGDAGYERAATDEEIARMCAVLQEALQAGAAGLATSFAMTHRGEGGRPVPSRFADRREFDALAATVGDWGRGVVSVAPGDQVGIADLYDIQPRIGVPVTYGALLTMPGGQYRKMAELNAEGREAGIQVWPQVTSRPLSFSMTVADPFTLNANPVFAELMSRSRDDRRAAYADPAWRERAQAAFAQQRGLVPRWDTYEITEAPDASLVGRRLSAVAEDRGADPFDTLLDLAVEADLDLRVRAILANDDTEGVEFLLGLDHCPLGLSDAGAHVGQLCDAPQPTDFLGLWVRERELMPIEQAVRKLTGTQADLFGFADRGYVRLGAHADLAVFDPATVAPGPVRRVRDFPADAERLTADQPTGMRHVVVNGTPIVRDGVLDPVAVAGHPGEIVRPAPRG